MISPTNIAVLLERALELSKKAAVLAASGRDSEAMDLEDEADVLRKQARLARQKELKARSAQESQNISAGSARENAINGLAEIGVPVSPRALAEFVTCRFARILDHTLLASMRRDEQRAWASPRSHRSAYLVPALSAEHFVPMRGKIALSNWSIERRIIGPWSERVDHLTATLNLVHQLEWLLKSDPDVGRSMERLVAYYGATIPGALDEGGRIDTIRVARATNAELQMLKAADYEWRQEAADRARRVLDEGQLLWGAPAPKLVNKGKSS